jgi:hypothetical protein
MRDYKFATSVNLSTKVVADLRREAARQTIKTGKRVTSSGLVREYVEKALYGEVRPATAE